MLKSDHWFLNSTSIKILFYVFYIILYIFNCISLNIIYICKDFFAIDIRNTSKNKLISSIIPIKNYL